MSNHYLVDIKNFEKIEQISIGGFGIVNLVLNKKTGKKMAAKTNFQSNDPRYKKQVSREIQILMRIQHPTIVHFGGFSKIDFSGSNLTTIFLDFMEGGSLQNIIQKTPKDLKMINFNNTNKQIILAGIALGMMTLHVHRVIHRDLKPGNILLDQNYRPRITDFGLSKFCSHDNSSLQSISNIGTIPYMAPEVISSIHFNYKADVYAFGILMYEIITGLPAYYELLYGKKSIGIYALQTKVLKGYRPQFTVQVKPQLKKLIKKCWSKNPSNRPSFAEIFEKLSLSYNNKFFINELNSASLFEEEEDFDFIVDSKDDDDDEVNNLQSSTESYDSISSQESEDKIDGDFYNYEFEEDENEKEPDSLDFCLDDVDVEKLREYLDDVIEEIKNLNKEKELKLSNRNSENFIITEEEKYNKENHKSEEENEKIIEEENDKNENENDKSEEEKNKSENENGKSEEEKNKSENENDKSEEEKNKSENENGKSENESMLDNSNDDDDDEFLKSDDDDDEEGIREGDEVKIFKSEHSIIYRLSRNRQIAEVIESPSARGDVFIPQFVKFQSVKYKVIRICDKAFKSSKISTLSFAYNSSVKRIGNFAFENTTFSELYIPSNLNKLSDFWSFGAKEIKEIEVDENNSHFSVKDGFLIYKKNEVLFAPIDFNGKFIVPQNVTRIGNYTFANHQGISSLASSSSSFEKVFDSYSFYNCENLENATFSNESKLRFGNHCFSKSSKLSNVKIQCNELNVGDECFSDCSSLSLIQFSVSEKVTLGSKAFQNCSQLDAVALFKINSVVIEKECFLGANNLKSIAFVAKSVILRENFIRDCQSLSLVTIKCSNDITIFTDTFKGCNLKNVILKSESNLKLMDSCFSDQSARLELIKLKGKSISIGIDCFTNCNSIKSIMIKSDNDLNLKNNTFGKCKSLQSIVMCSNSSLIIGNEFMNDAAKLEKVEAMAKDVIVGDNCFANCSSLTKFTISKSGNIKIGINQFAKCQKLEKVSFESSSSKNYSVRNKIRKNSFANSNANINDNNNYNNNNDNNNNYSNNDNNYSNNNNVNNFSNSNNNNNYSNNNNDNNDNNNDNDNNNNNNNYSNNNNDNNDNDNNNNNNNYSNNNNNNNDNDNNNHNNNNNSNNNNDDAADNSQTPFEIEFGQRCFCGAENLLEIVIIKGNVNIDNCCLKDCPSLKAIRFLDVSNLRISKDQFKGCNSLSTIIINSRSQVELCSNCFEGLTKLNTFHSTSRDIFIGNNCFNRCTSLSNFVITNSGKFKIGSNQFTKCDELKKIEIKARANDAATNCSEIELGSNCFSGLKNLTQFEIIGGDLTVDTFCFKDCASLESLKLTKMQKVKIEKDQFYNCKMLKTINIESESLVDLCHNCFSGLPHLESVFVNAKEIFVGNKCFEYCGSLSQVEFVKPLKITLGSNVFSRCEKFWNADFRADNQVVAGDSCFMGSSVKTANFQSQTVTLKNSCFRECGTIKSFSILSSKDVEIECRAFENCKCIEKVEVKNFETLKAGERCFYGDKSLSIVDFQGNELTIGSFGFYFCHSLKIFDLKITNKVKFDDYVFSDCKFLEKVNIEANAEIRAGNYCFYKARSLTELSSNALKATIGEFCFSCCGKLTDIHLKSATDITFFENSFDNRTNEINFDVKNDVRKTVNQSISNGKCDIF